MNEATGSKINDFDLTPRVTFNEDVFRLQITMNQIQIMNEVESVKDLFGDLLESWNVEVVFFLDLSVVLGVLIEVISE